MISNGQVYTDSEKTPIKSKKKSQIMIHLNKYHDIPWAKDLKSKKSKKKIVPKNVKPPRKPTETTFVPFICVECSAEFIDEKYLKSHNCDGKLFK